MKKRKCVWAGVYIKDYLAALSDRHARIYATNCFLISELWKYIFITRISKTFTQDVFSLYLFFYSWSWCVGKITCLDLSLVKNLIFIKGTFKILQNLVYWLILIKSIKHISQYIGWTNYKQLILSKILLYHY